MSELEAWLGQPLFDRRGRELHLTDAGRVALEHAETIFTTGHELITRFRQSEAKTASVFSASARSARSQKICSSISSSRFSPTRGRKSSSSPVRWMNSRGSCTSTKWIWLLSNIPLRADQEQNVFNHLLGEVPVFLVGGKKLKLSPGKFPKFLKDVPLFLPSRQSDVRADFDLILANAGIEPFVHAEVDDMALLRLLALSGEGLALVSKIVVERELQSSKIKFMERVPGLVEKYYALTVRKRFANAWLGEIVETFRTRLKHLAAATTS